MSEIKLSLRSGTIEDDMLQWVIAQEYDIDKFVTGWYVFCSEEDLLIPGSDLESCVQYFKEILGKWRGSNGRIPGFLKPPPYH